MLTTVASGRVFNYSYCIGMYGASGRGFWDPQDFVLGSDGVLYVVSRGDSEGIGPRITKCAVDHQFFGQFGGWGYEKGQFIWPRSIDGDRDGNLYVSDEHLHQISIFDKEGQFVGRWGKPGSAVGELQGPAGSQMGNGGAWQLAYLFAPGLRVAGGTDEILRNIIAERVLRLPPEPRIDKKLAFREVPTGPANK